MGGPNLEVFKVSQQTLNHSRPTPRTIINTSPQVRHVHHVPHRDHVLLRHEPGLTLRRAGLLAQARPNPHAAVRARGDLRGTGAPESATTGHQGAEVGGGAEGREHAALRAQAGGGGTSEPGGVGESQGGPAGEEPGCEGEWVGELVWVGEGVMDDGEEEE